MNSIWQYKFRTPLIEKAVQRKELLFRVKDESTIYLIEASAGYGKTYFAHQIAQKQDTPVLWYSVGKEDNDSRVFIQGIIAGFEHITGETEIIIKTPGNRLFLSAEILIRYINKKFKSGLTIVLDDFHLISNPDTLRLVTYMLDASSVYQINFVLTSRNRIEFAEAKLMSRGGMTRFSGDELRFTEEELKSYLDAREIEYTQHKISELYYSTAGWIAAVNLILLSDRTIKGDNIADMSSLADYINLEIMDSLSPEMRSFLVNTSILDMLEADICDDYLLITNSAELLEKLEKQHFLLYKTGDGVYKIHDIIRESLREQIDDHEQLYARAAQTYINQDRSQTGIDYLLSANLLEKAAELMERYVPMLIRQGNWPVIKNWMSYFDDKLIYLNGFLCILAAELEIYNFSIYTAEKYLLKAKSLFEEKRDQIGYARCLNVEARILRSQGKYKESIEKLEDVMEVLAGERFDISTEKALSYLLIGEFDNVEKTLQQAYEKALDNMDNTVIAHIAACMAHFNYLIGDYGNAVSLYNKVASLSDNDLYIIHSQRNCLASIYQDWGMLDKALDFARDDIAVKERYNLLDTLPYAYYQLGHIYVDLGQFDIAEQYYHKAIATADEVGGETFFKILSKMLLARCYIKRGNIFRARATSREAIQEAVNEGGYIEAMCCTLMGVTFLQMNKLAEAEMFIGRGRELIENVQPRYFLTMLYGALSHIAMKKKDYENLNIYGMLYIDLAASNNFLQMSVVLYKIFRPVIEELPQEEFSFAHKAFIMELDDRCKKPGLISKIINTEKHMVASSHKNLQAMLDYSQEVPYVVNMFGPFELYYRNNQLGIKGLFSQKAKELLTLLLHRSQSLSKEEIIDNLWPDTKSKNIDNVFHATLYNLRKGLKKIDPEYEYITYEDGRYYIEKGVFFCTPSYYGSDLIIMADADKLGKQEIKTMSAILDYYNRGYLYNIDKEWAEKSRAYYESIFEKAAIRVSRYCLVKDKNLEAARILYKLVELNPYMDEAYYLLIKAKMAENQHQLAKRIYDNYVTVIKNEIDTGPLEKISKLFAK